MPEAEDAPPPARNVFAYRGYNILLGASLLGALGDRFYQGLMIAAANEIFVGKSDALKELSNRQGLNVQIYSILPMLILYALAGSLIDACDRRKLLARLEGLKIVMVLGFAWLFRDMAGLGQIGSTGEIPREWLYGMGLVVLLNIVTVPFSPARASVVPDVLPEERRSMGASLIATAGLCSYLIGGFAGLNLARTDMLGPVKMAVLSSVLFLLSSILFKLLPVEASIPNNQKKGEGDGAPPKKMSAGEYVSEQLDGFKYCLKHGSILALIFFETVFWTVASMVNVFLFFYASFILSLEGPAKTQFTSVGLGIAGLGIVGGALAAGKMARNISPIVTFTTAFLLVGVGFMYAFGSQPLIEMVAGAEVRTASWIFNPMLFLMALGGGLMLGRVDADILSIADERYRGRIFSLKAVAFGICTLLATYYLSNRLSPAEKLVLIHWIPRILLGSLPLVFCMAWVVDTAIWANRAHTGPPGFRARMQFKLCRNLLWIWMKLQFRFSVVGAEKIPKSGGVLLAANHGSFLDPVFLGCGCPRAVQYMMYSSYYKSFAHPLFRFLSAIPVDEKKNLLALKTGVASLKQGCCLGVFPEGRVSAERKLSPPQGGAMFLAQHSGATVVPAALIGNWDAFPRWQKFPSFFKKVTVVFGEPFIVPKEASKQEVAAAGDRLMADIAKMLNMPPPAKKASTDGG